VQLLKEDGLHSDPAEKGRRNQEWNNSLQCFFSVEFLQQQWKLLFLVESLRLGVIGE
jgi:hypothetical protein